MKIEPKNDHAAMPLVPYGGGKWRMRKWINSLMPQSVTCYVETCGGTLSVLFDRQPAHIEIVNDFNGAIVALYRTLQKKDDAERLIYRLENTAYARAEYKLASSILHSKERQSDHDLAWAWFVSQCLGFSGRGAYANSFGASIRRQHAQPFRNKIENLAWVMDRLDGVMVEQLDAIHLVKKYDDAHVLFYLDPPYPKGTWSHTSKAYANVPEDSWHEELVETLIGLKGMIALSSYPNPIYDRLLEHGWTYDTKVSDAPSLGRTKANKAKYEKDGTWHSERMRTEILYRNMACVRALESECSEPELNL